MIDLSLKYIREISHDLSFKRGVQYYQNGCVGSLTPLDTKIHSTVHGNIDYNVELTFNPEHGNLTSFSCDCPAFNSYSGACKHIVASLLKILYTKEKLSAILKEQSNKSVIDEFSNVLKTHIYPSSFKQKIHLEVVFELNKNTYPCLSLKIGIDKYYIVKDIAAFMDAAEKENELVFGKSFIFSPQKQVFDIYSQKIFDFVSHILHKTKGSSPEDYPDYINSLSNSLFIPNSSMSELLNIINSNCFTLKYKGVFTKSNIINSLPCISFKISQDNDYVISPVGKHDFFPLTDDYEYIFLDSYIYHLSLKERKIFSLAVKHFNGFTKALTIEKHNAGELSDIILPVLSNLGPFTYNTQLEKNIIFQPLTAVIHLDKHKNTIRGTLHFTYGNYSFYIFPQKPSNLSEDKIVLRDLEKEQSILQILSNPIIKPDFLNNCFTLSNPDDLYEFIYILLPKLQEAAEVFYSEDFKNIRIKEASAVKASIQLNPVSDMLDFSFSVEGIDKKELPGILNAVVEKKKYYRLKDGSFLRLENDNKLNELSDILVQLNIKNKIASNESVALPKYRTLFVEQLLSSSSIESKTDEKLMALISDIKAPTSNSFVVPQSLSSTLRSYQKTGYQWLKQLSKYGFGGILADDMGLGKTIQAITLLASLPASAKSIVIAPTSLVYNWEDEFNRFAPELKVLVISGDKKQRALLHKKIDTSQIIITSYGLLKRDIELYTPINFSYCFIDEAQHIKNPSSLNAKAVKLVNAKTRIALTGTPIENSLSELWSIFDFIMPGYLYSHSKFTKTYERPIIKSQDNQALVSLNLQIQPFILRRLKSDVLKELPPKIEAKIPTELSDKQKKLYYAYLEKTKSELLSEIDRNGFEKSKLKIFSVLTRLRQICCHPALFDNAYSGTSGKLDLLEEIILDALSSKHRALVFSQFTSMLKLIIPVLEKNNITYFYLDGSTESKERRDMVKAFNKGEREIFLISLKAGGTGLNLTGADMVIHYDPWWNPAVEDQATDRAYRIGQNRSVQVMRLITQGTIEEKIYKLQEKKKTLIDSVIKPGETFIHKLSETEIRELLS